MTNLEVRKGEVPVFDKGVIQENKEEENRKDSRRYTNTWYREIEENLEENSIEVRMQKFLSFLCRFKNSYFYIMKKTQAKSLVKNYIPFKHF